MNNNDMYKTTTEDQAFHFDQHFISFMVWQVIQDLFRIPNRSKELNW